MKGNHHQAMQAVLEAIPVPQICKLLITEDLNSNLGAGDLDLINKLHCRYDLVLETKEIAYGVGMKMCNTVLLVVLQICSFLSLDRSMIER